MRKAVVSHSSAEDMGALSSNLSAANNEEYLALDKQSKLVISCWNDSLIVSIAGRMANNKSPYPVYSNENKLSIYLHPDKACQLIKVINWYLSLPEEAQMRENCGVISGKSVIYIAKEAVAQGINTFTVNIVNTALGTVCKYYCRQSLKEVFRNYNLTNNQYEVVKNGFECFDIEILLGQLWTFCQAQNNIMAYSMLNAMKSMRKSNPMALPF